MSASSSPTTYRFQPRNAPQAELLAAYQYSDVLFALGPAGTGKTASSVAVAIGDVLSGATGRKRLVCIRPAVESCESLGFIPGSVDEKLEPYAGPFHQSLALCTHKLPKELITFQAIAFLRGITFSDCVVVVDEAQNLSLTALKLVLSRLGRNAKILLSGDPAQADISASSLHDYPTDLEYVAYRCEGLPSVALVHFDASHNLRHPLVSKILQRL